MTTTTTTDPVGAATTTTQAPTGNTSTTTPDGKTTTGGPDGNAATDPPVDPAGGSAVAMAGSPPTDPGDAPQQLPSSNAGGNLDNGIPDPTAGGTATDPGTGGGGPSDPGAGSGGGGDVGGADFATRICKKGATSKTTKIRACVHY